MEVTRSFFLNALKEAASYGANKALEEAGLSKPYVSMNKANKMYGKGTIKRMVEEGLINPVKDGANSSTIKIDRKDLRAAAMVLDVNY